MYKQVMISSLRPNPYRDIEKYEIKREKIEKLKQSFEATDFWENIVVRQNGDGYEMAYGHHRWVALQELYGPRKKVGVLVKDLDNETMIRMMANENMAEWSSDFLVEIETVEQVVKAYARGDIELDAVPETIKKESKRFAPSFIQGADPTIIDDLRHGEDHISTYTSSTISNFLNWKEMKVWESLRALESIEKGYIKRKDLRGLGPKVCMQLVSDATRNAEAIAKAELARETAKKGITPKSGEYKREKARIEKSPKVRNVARETVSKAKQAAAKSDDKKEAVKRAAKKVREDIIGKQMPEIHRASERIATMAEKFLVSNSKESNELRDIIQYRKHLEDKARKRLIQALDRLSSNALKLKARLEKE